ncbi:phytanoyl-CoA dioxygenase family protein [Achromobacter aloeverae]|uniref:Phytanoyl-CoA dioxygenase n=1 Tax=Achromobacter aloeverae TaxID=1750518 RepID=A0A4Q1HS07_9BURK|nr:phytanoyl-CoA dioxygenase family protein [Achromobacter aloeverae]RXN92785.1 phytanoyl-CoA dioxygenase [Achromobacter aloeverae]
MGKKLTQGMIEQYREKGYVSPVDVFSAAQAADYLAQLESFEASQGRQLTKGFNFKPHLLFPWVAEIARHPAVLDAVEDLIGPDILLFHLSVWPKNPHDPAYINWHQDATYFGLDPSTQVTAWVALSDASVEAGCMEVVPGSQKLGQLHHGQNHTDNILLSKGQTVDVPFDRSHTEFMPVSAGQMSLHDTFLIHASGPNNTDRRRVGLGFSYIPASSRCVSKTRLTASLVRGRDYGNFDLEPAPMVANGEAERAFHEDAVRRFRSANDELAATY